MLDYYEKPGISQSMLKTYLKCPNLYTATYVEKTYESERTDAMVTGTAVDILLTEPDKFDDLFEVVKRRANGNYYDGKFYLTQTQMDDITATVEKVKLQPVMAEFDWMDTQTEIYWQDFKGKLDWFGVKRGVAHIADLKTTQDLDKFYRSAEDFGYYFQMAFYRMLAKGVYPNISKFKCYWVVVDKTKQKKFSVYEIDQRRFKTEEKLIHTILAAMKTNKRLSKGVCYHCPVEIGCEYSLFTKKHIGKL